MKRLVFVTMVILLAMAILAVGCARTPPAPATTQNVTGVLKNLNTPDNPGKDTVTIQTPGGDKTFALSANTTFSVEGRSCTLEQVGQAVDEGNVTYECTVVMAGLTPAGEDTSVLAVYVRKK